MPTLVTGTENKPDVEAFFYKAIDEDNNGVSPGDEDYDNVYYYIVGQCVFLSVTCMYVFM